MPQCKKCSRIVSDDQMHRQLNRKKDGYYQNSHCKDCERDYQLNYKKQKAQPDVPLVLPLVHLSSASARTDWRRLNRPSRMNWRSS